MTSSLSSSYATLLIIRSLYHRSKTLDLSSGKGLSLASTSVLDVEVYPNMPRNWSTTIPEGNDPVRRDEIGSDQPTLADLYRMIGELFDKSDRELDEVADEMRATKKGLAGLEQDARQPRLAMEADVPSDTKTHTRMEDAVAVQARYGNSCSANQIDPDPTCLISFGDDSTGPPAFPCTRDDALIDNGATASKPCLPPVGMCTPTAAGGLLPTGTASTAMMTIFPRQLFSWILGETKKHTSRINCKLAPSWRRVIQTKSRQTLVFDPGGCTGHLRTCPFLGTWRALLCGEVLIWERLVVIWSVF